MGGYFIGDSHVENKIGAFIGHRVILVEIYPDSGHYRPCLPDIEYFMYTRHGVIHAGFMVDKI